MLKKPSARIPYKKRQVTLDPDHFEEVERIAKEETLGMGGRPDRARIVACLLDWALREYGLAQRAGYQSGLSAFRFVYRARPVPVEAQKAHTILPVPDPAALPKELSETDEEFLRSCGISPDE